MLEWTSAEPGEQDKEQEEEKQHGELDSKIHDGRDFILLNDEQGVETPPRGRSSSLAYPVTVVESLVQYSQSLDGEGKATESGRRQDTDIDSGKKKEKGMVSRKGKEKSVLGPTVETSKNENESPLKPSVLPR